MCWGYLHSVFTLGLIWDVRPGQLGLELSVRGFSQRAPALLTDLAAALANFDPCGERELAAFDIVRNPLYRCKDYDGRLVYFRPKIDA